MSYTNKISETEPKSIAIPFRQAMRAWNELRLTPGQLEEMIRWQKKAGESAAAHEAVDGECPVCHFRQWGFVCFSFAPVYPLFGKPVYCPNCWPYPFGVSPQAILPAGETVRKLETVLTNRLANMGIYQ